MKGDLIQARSPQERAFHFLYIQNTAGDFLLENPRLCSSPPHLSCTERYTAILSRMSDTKKYVVKKSSAGLGLFATAPFKKGELVIEYTGETITEAEANVRGGKYLFELNDNWTIDGKDRDNTARYLNHACKPNCNPELNEEETKIFIYAKRAIKEGEELTYNYGKMYFNDLIKKDGCLCAGCKEKLVSN